MCRNHRPGRDIVRHRRHVISDARRIGRVLGCLDRLDLVCQNRLHRRACRAGCVDRRLGISRDGGDGPGRRGIDVRCSVRNRIRRSRSTRRSVRGSVVDPLDARGDLQRSFFAARSMFDRVGSGGVTSDHGDNRGGFTRLEDRARDGRTRLGIRTVSGIRNRNNVALHYRRCRDRGRRRGRPLRDYAGRRDEVVRDDGLV